MDKMAWGRFFVSPTHEEGKGRKRGDRYLKYLIGRRRNAWERKKGVVNLGFGEFGVSMYPCKDTLVTRIKAREQEVVMKVVIAGELNFGLTRSQ